MSQLHGDGISVIDRLHVVEMKIRLTKTCNVGQEILINDNYNFDKKINKFLKIR